MSHCSMQSIDAKTTTDKCCLLSLFLGHTAVSRDGTWMTFWVNLEHHRLLCPLWSRFISTAKTLSSFGLLRTDSNIMDVDLGDAVFLRNYWKLQLWLYVFILDTLENDYNYIEKRVWVTWWAILYFKSQKYICTFTAYFCEVIKQRQLVLCLATNDHSG